MLDNQQKQKNPFEIDAAMGTGFFPPTGDSSQFTGDELGLHMFDPSIMSDDSNMFFSFSGDDYYESAQYDEHRANLADYIDPQTEQQIVDDILEKIRADYASREDWMQRIVTAMELMGVMDMPDDERPFRGAATMTHPMIHEAAVQFGSRAMKELCPPKGPVKTLVDGDQTKQIRAQAERVQDHMNYQVTIQDEGYYDSMEHLLHSLPIYGSCFKKTYFDHIKQMIISRTVRADDLLVPYTAESMEDAPRYTHVQKWHHNDVKKMMRSGHFRNIDIEVPTSEHGVAYSFNDLQDQIDEASGRSMSYAINDHRHIIYETATDYDLPGFEDVDEEGDPTGVGLPYVFSIDFHSRRILGIYRNWRMDDERKAKINWVTHFRYLPGLGFYGFGLVHAIGGLAAATTGAVRALLDSAAWATLQGGFKDKNASISGDWEMEPGVWHDVDMTFEELSKAFYTPPFKEPSMALFELVRLFEENGRRFAGTTEAVVGDASNTGPVGTTVALIEQATQVMSGIHTRLHRAQGKEFRLRAELNREYLPNEPFYFNVVGASKHISSQDYSQNIRVIPVSDPNITSQTQRIAVSQTLLELSERAPHLYRDYRVHQRMHEALGIEDSESLLIDPDNIKRQDPMAEGASIRAGRPIKAFQDQNHEAHLAVHQMQMEYLKTLDDKQAQPLMLELMDHMSKHEAFMLYVQNAAMSGLDLNQLPPLDLYDDDSPESQGIPPEVENMVAELAAQRAMEIMQFYQSRIPAPPEDMEAKAKVAREDEIALANEQRDQKSWDAEEFRKQKEWENEQARKDASVTRDNMRE